MSYKNVWRTRGALQFKRRTRRYHDGTPFGGDVLYIRIKGKACVFAETGNELIDRPGKLWFHAGTYRCEPHVIAAHIMRNQLYHEAYGAGSIPER